MTIRPLANALSKARRLHLQIGSVALSLCIAGFVHGEALAGTTGGTAMPWETPLQTIQDSLAGPVAKAIGIIAIVITGLGFAFSEGGSTLRKGIGIVFGLAIAFTATTFISSFFSMTSGAAF